MGSRTDWLDVGEAALRLKIDMSSGNINMRDPVIYRLKVDATHPQTGDKWKIYPMYDYAHCLTDALEGATASPLSFSQRFACNPSV